MATALPKSRPRSGGTPRGALLAACAARVAPAQRHCPSRAERQKLKGMCRTQQHQFCQQQAIMRACWPHYWLAPLQAQLQRARLARRQIKQRTARRRVRRFRRSSAGAETARQLQSTSVSCPARACTNLQKRCQTTWTARAAQACSSGPMLRHTPSREAH